MWWNGAQVVNKRNLQHTTGMDGPGSSSGGALWSVVYEEQEWQRIVEWKVAGSGVAAHCRMEDPLSVQSLSTT